MSPGNRPPRILHYPTDTGGHPLGLSLAERDLGFDSEVVLIRSNKFAYEADRVLIPSDAGKAKSVRAQLAFAAFDAWRYDILHFNFGRTLFPLVGGLGVDLPLLRALGKTIITTFQGCDARLRSDCEMRDLSCCGGRGDTPGLCAPEWDTAKRQAIEYVSKWSHRVFVLNPDLCRCVPKGEFLPYASVDPKKVTPPTGPRRPGPVRVLHAPTSRAKKGTDAVLAACGRLRTRVDFELVLVENLTHAEAMKRYEDADVLVDQLRIGWYGGLAIELMSMGKPVIAYIRDEDLHHIPERMAQDIPVVSATPDTIEDVLESLILDESRRIELGERSRAYMERWHDPRMIAERLLGIHEDPCCALWSD